MLVLLILIIFIYIIFLLKINNETFSGIGRDSHHLNNGLKQIVKDLDEYNINNWFIVYGTLLGIVRNNSCINNDDDIDIIIDKKESNKLHKLIKKKYKYVVGKKEYHTNFIKINLGVGLNNIIVDWYVADKKDNNYNDTWDKIVWSNVYPFKKKKWNNVILNLPNNYKKKLENMYGNDWKIPRQWKGPKNIKVL
jgi:phosphorylcholine metabolism protein LicD